MTNFLPRDNPPSKSSCLAHLASGQNLLVQEGVDMQERMKIFLHPL